MPKPRASSASVPTKDAKLWCRTKNLSQVFLLVAAVWLTVVMHSHQAILAQVVPLTETTTQQQQHEPEFYKSKNGVVIRHVVVEQPQNRKKIDVIQQEIPKRVKRELDVPAALASANDLGNDSDVWKTVLDRAEEKRDHCMDIDARFKSFASGYSMIFGKDNQTLATLPPFGIVEKLKDERLKPTQDPKWQCEMPPETECEETQLTVVFMAYNPDRLGITLNQIRKLLSREAFSTIVKECVMVWNGPRHVDESEEGKKLLEFAKSNPLRVVYPLKMGFPNDLMNRYHPDVVKVTTKAILYYDDDGPFYSYKAIESGFELWKRNAKAQIGAMSRRINYSARQDTERTQLDPQPNDRLFVSHCDNLKDSVEYNFFYFANYDANMVLPSGSMLHSNYLCFLWHPVFSEIRQFVLDHPVHPDDITVSTIVSQLAGRAPKVYSRRLNPASAEDRKKYDMHRDEELLGGAQQQRRRLTESKKGGIGGICWDCGSGMTEKKQIWADLRSQAINTLIRYFGSINSGSIGWCEGTQFYDPKKDDGRCKPIMAKQGWLPWMNKDGSPKQTCP